MTNGAGQVVGQVVALAFLARLWQGAPGQAQVPRGTAVYLALFALLNLLAHAGVLPAASLAFEADLVTQQPWRLATGFFIADGLGTGFGLQLWFFTAYSSLLERRFFGRAPLRYVSTLGLGALLIIAQAWLLSSARPLSLSYALCFFHVARWSRTDPHRRVEILSTLTVRAALVPWCLLALALPIFGAHTSLANLYGIGAALALDAASALPFIGGDRSPGHENRNGAGGGVGAGRGGQKGKGGKEKKGAGANRERWTRIAQVSAAVVVVAYHSGARLAELRAGRRAEAAMSRQIAAVMDADAPNVAALLGKFGETRPLTADAASMLSLWTYATEHWHQALALPAAAINVNNLSSADGETLRQVVAQALSRTEIPEEMADVDVLPEVFQQLGYSRLLVLPHAQEHFAGPVAQFRKGRSRTVAAWGFIKHLVYHGDQPEQRALNQTVEIFSTVNASLAEYDLPTSMTDESVLGELFGLLDLPRDAVSYRVEQLLLRAIREHRRARAGVAAATVDELMARLNALLVNDTAAVGPTGTPRLGIHEMWSTGAANETMVGVLTEAFNWMEVSAETSDDDAWARLLALTNMTAADEERTLRLEDGSSMLRAAFDAVRKRRALDWETQQVFEELIATVRLEDPVLAADENKKKLMNARYEAIRIGWMGKLLRRAKQLKVDGAAAALASLGADAAQPAGGDADGAAEAEADEVDSWDVDWDDADPAAWANETRELVARREEREAEPEPSAAEASEKQKQEHYARLLKLPGLISQTLSTWIEPGEELSDKQMFQELLRLMGLADTVEPRLMRTMVEAVKQHRLRRERDDVERGDWAEGGPEPISARATMQTAYPTLKQVDGLVNCGGDGNDFAVFIARLMHALGAKVRINVGCASDVRLPSKLADGAAPWEVAAHEAALAEPDSGGGDRGRVCQMFTEVRLGKQPAKIVGWVRAWLPGSKWLGMKYHHRRDREGYAWLTLDWIDGHRLQRPGAPYKKFDSLTSYHVGSSTWEAEGDETDSAGEPRLKHSPVESIKLGLR